MKSPKFIHRPAPRLGAALGSRLSVTTWNLGYGGLGAGSDFVTDGGKNWLPPSRSAVGANVAGIVQTLRSDPCDVILAQEVARGGLPNYWVDLEARARAALADREQIFQPDAWSRIPVLPLQIEHGLAIYSKAQVQGVEIQVLPQDGDINTGGLVKRYVAVAVRLASGGGGPGWTLVDVHLAAFDPRGDLRRRQAAAVIDWARSEYAAGRAVVIGGDWNMRLAETDFAHTTEAQHLHWVVDFDRAALPEGWAIACDPRVASVRTNERPYRQGENYTAVIDGFVVSPNVRVEDVAGVDLGFRWSDHQPVRARFRAEDR